ncbi:predicted protein [Naegleria gruberi]|uniref:Predicted protein n=1 Tax=Naegleria gruberi TaxID=5762 RepID=D2VQA7_NAEGR|nr:uncharacterized protein NAEGRDRAFT_58899 [Naegleria gruberi]EFC41010.1 predicted protein [Naegleria gruberi]|eukprot:XP_002673754.1 predicted protein [Naegleria gruberi strain NEG-M]
MITTHQCAPSNATTGSARLDLFFKAARGIEESFLLQLVEASWNENPLDTLKLIFQTRDCRGGKGEREIFHKCLNWLIDNHPEDLLVNLELLPEYGRWEDLLRYINQEKGKIGETISKLFAEQLRKDYAAMHDGKPVTLCAKWAPTENCKHDKKFSAVKLIAKELGIKKAEYRKQYLSPLREYIKVVERYMCLKQWDAIDYSKVPGNAMNKLKKAFNKHDPERFAEYMKKLEKGETKVNATTVEPHEIVAQFMYGQAQSETDQILESQWKEIVKRVQSLGNMDHALAVVDVSGSMSGTPLKGKLISFHEDPQFCTINLNTTLRERAQEIMLMPWGMSTNFYKVFETILREAKQNKLTQDEMPTSIYVISDMQFASAAGSSMSNLEYIKKSYAEAGYELPKLIFWNVNGNSRDFVSGNALENNVAMISGFSPSLLKAVLNGDDFTPFAIMMKAIQDERYSKIKLASSE